MPYPKCSENTCYRSVMDCRQHTIADAASIAVWKYGLYMLLIYTGDGYFCLALSMIGLVMNQMIMWFAVEHFRDYAVAKIFSTMLVTTYNFISRKRFLEA